MDYQEIREKQVDFLNTVLNEDKIMQRVNGCEFSRFNVYSDKIEINNLVIGYIKPKNGNCFIEFDKRDLKLVTMDFELEKDLNSEKMVCRVNNGTFEVFDMNSFDELEYVEDFLDDIDESFVLGLLKQYDCSYSELAERYLDDYGIEDIVGDMKIQEIQDDRFGIVCQSIEGLDSIYEDLNENNEIVLFDNAKESIENIKKYCNVFNSKVLNDDDLYNIGISINKICKSNFDDTGVVGKILKNCDLI